MVLVPATTADPLLKLACPPPELLPPSPNTLNSAIFHPAAALTALSPVVLYAVPATNMVTLSPVELTVPDRLSWPSLVIGWAGTATDPALSFFQQDMPAGLVN